MFTNANFATANDLLVEITSDNTFSPDIAYVTSGETIKCSSKVNGHKVGFVKVPTGANLPPKSVLSRNPSIKFVKTGVYFIWCTPNKAIGIFELVVFDNDVTN